MTSKFDTAVNKVLSEQEKMPWYLRAADALPDWLATGDQRPGKKMTPWKGFKKGVNAGSWLIPGTGAFKIAKAAKAAAAAAKAAQAQKAAKGGYAVLNTAKSPAKQAYGTFKQAATTADPGKGTGLMSKLDDVGATVNRNPWWIAGGAMGANEVGDFDVASSPADITLRTGLGLGGKALRKAKSIVSSPSRADLLVPKSDINATAVQANKELRAFIKQSNPGVSDEELNKMYNDNKFEEKNK